MLALPLAVACRHPPHDPPVVPSDMSWVTTSDDPRQWQTAGFLELTTPVRPPTTEDGTAHIVVVLRVPRGELISEARMPVGTTAARVEYAGPAHAPDDAPDRTWIVLDVRQFDWTSAGIDCTVLRPDGDGRLVGLRWTCGAGEDARAGELLAGFMREQRFSGPRGDDGRERSAHRLRLVNDCRSCHQLDRPEDRSVTALVQRGTDGSGLFSVRSVFRDEDPVERYRPVDTNAGDPTMTPICPDSEIDLAAARCRDGRRPRLRVDVEQGLRAHGPHVTQLCATRRRLATLLDPAARASIQPALAVCAAE
ncbi:hypothetical protein BH11MYX3_BH11MYX3_19830 [soil metagenome]